MASTQQPAHKEYVIAGVKVLFPVKPYPSQIAMMAQILKGLSRRHNCLLESPTGSGKSLALLCSTLAWQQAEKEKADRHNDLIVQGVRDPDILARAAGVTNVQYNDDSFLGLPLTPNTQGGPQNDTFGTQMPSATAAAAAAATGGGFIPEYEDSDFRPDVRQFRVPTEIDVTLGNNEPNFMDVDYYDNPEGPTPRFMRVPKIYFGTRTHKQIYQIMKELRRTAYKYVKTDILSSREHTCIHPQVRTQRNKTELCQQLLDPHTGLGCKYNHGVSKIKTHDKLHDFGIQPAWDIEDLVKLGKKISACPYYASRSLKETADVIFCPYNYLIDPIIRDMMNLNLTGQIVVLDEAHNIEDSARESSSCTIKQEDIFLAIQDLKKVSDRKKFVDECKALSEILDTLNDWVDQYIDQLTDYSEFDRSGKIFTGTEMVAYSNSRGIDREKLNKLQKFLAILGDKEVDDIGPKIKALTSMLFKSIFLMYNFLLMDNMKYIDDYRVAIVRAQVRNAGRPDSEGFFSRKKVTGGWEYSINFWCLNPAVAFCSVGSSARSIILTSGTLSPMSSFQSELAVPFQIQLEANHVIDKNQVWVGTISRGPTEQTLQATYRNTETWDFQDELGRLVLEVCRVIPHGVLCFLPSYSMLNKLLERWQCTGMWNELSLIKVAITEPRKAEEFESAMSLFYDTVRDTKNGQGDSLNGAFFMAVCRGKVSEGLDFTDDNARAVIAVGIPFPSIKDIQVDLKRQYNNKHFKNRGLLSGSDWYEIQAYRALNQALGRCIRHRYDWGALILVDERFQRRSLANGVMQTKYTNGLSKWVREKIVHHTTFPLAISHLRQFSEYMHANPPLKPESFDETIMIEVNSKESEEIPSPTLTREEKNLISSVNTNSLFGTYTPMLSRFGQNPVPSLSPQARIPIASQSQKSAEVGGFDTSVVGGIPYVVNDLDFSESEDLVIPPIRGSITSTQIIDTKDEVIIPLRSAKIPVAETLDLFPVVSTVCEPKTPIVMNGEHSISYIKEPFKTPASESRPSKRRKSFSFKTENYAECHNVSKVSMLVNEGNKHPKLESSTSAALPKNFASKKEDPFSFRDNISDKNSFDNNQHDPEQKQNLEVKLQKKESPTTDSSFFLKGHCSPQLFDSDEDFFDDIPSSSKTKLQDERNYQPCSTPSNISSLAKYKKVEDGKENKLYSTKPKQTSLSSQLPISSLGEIKGDDSDMEDFCLDKSYNSPKKTKMRFLSKGKSTTGDLRNT